MKVRVIMCVVITLLISVTLTATETKKSKSQKGELIAYWNFNKGEGNVAKDSSGYGHDGKLIKSGEYTKWVPGKSGYALEFIGKSRKENGGLTINKMPKVFPEGVTIELWVKLNKNYKARGFHELVANAAGNRSGFRFMIFYDALQWRVSDGKKRTSSYSNSQKVAIPKGKWFHVAIVSKGKEVIIYLNGMKVARSTKEMLSVKGSDTWSVGSYNHGYAYPLNGAIDELKVYNYARSGIEILKSYNNLH